MRPVGRHYSAFSSELHHILLGIIIYVILCLILTQDLYFDLSLPEERYVDRYYLSSYYRSSISKAGARRLGPHSRGSSNKGMPPHMGALCCTASQTKGQDKSRRTSSAYFHENKANDVPPTHPTRQQSKGRRNRLATETAWLTHTHLVNV